MKTSGPSPSRKRCCRNWGSPPGTIEDDFRMEDGVSRLSEREAVATYLDGILRPVPRVRTRRLHQILRRCNPERWGVYCNDMVVRPYKAPCPNECRYCGSCLLQFLKVAAREVTNDAIFPPRCHQGVLLFPTKNFPASRDHLVWNHLPSTERENALRVWERALSAALEQRQGQLEVDRQLLLQILEDGNRQFQFCCNTSCQRLLLRGQRKNEWQALVAKMSPAEVPKDLIDESPSTPVREDGRGPSEDAAGSAPRGRSRLRRPSGRDDRVQVSKRREQGNVRDAERRKETRNNR